MPYPAKTNAQTILAAAIEQLEQGGEEALSLRELARTLELSSRALYRYYSDRATLEAAMAEEGFCRLYVALVNAVGGACRERVAPTRSDCLSCLCTGPSRMVLFPDALSCANTRTGAGKASDVGLCDGAF